MLTESIQVVPGPRIRIGTLHGLSTLLRIELITYFRSRSAVFWTFFYPVLLLVVLMAIFGGSRQAVFPLEVSAPPEHSVVRAIEERFRMIEGVTLKIVDVAADAPLSHGVPRIVGKYENTGPQSVDLLLGSEITTVSGATIAVIGEVVERLNRQHANAPEHYRLNYVFEAGAKKATQQASAAYYISGLTALTILSVALFGFTQPLVELRAGGALKPYHVLPVSRLTYLLAFSCCRFLILLGYALAFMMVAYIAYGVGGRGWGTWISLAGLIAAGIAAFLAAGLAIAAVVTRTSTAAAIVNIANLPLMFLSDLFIPTQIMPDFLQAAVRYSPVNQFVASLRDIANNGSSLAAEWPTLLMLLAIFLCGLMFAMRRFRWQASLS
jgi:ABC-2 type transport system permease protein